MPTPESPLETYLRRNYAGIYLTVSQAAAEVGVSADTLRRWRRRGITRAPSKTIQMGEQTVYLYTEEDIKELQRFAETSRRGKLLVPYKEREGA